MSSQIAVFLRGMEESGLVSDVLVKTHLIGFSLGAHVAGFAGSELKNISRITGGRGRMAFNTILYNYCIRWSIWWLLVVEIAICQFSIRNLYCNRRTPKCRPDGLPFTHRIPNKNCECQ